MLQMQPKKQEEGHKWSPDDNREQKGGYIKEERNNHDKDRDSRIEKREDRDPHRHRDN
jgi:hypothetical protein